MDEWEKRRNPIAVWREKRTHRFRSAKVTERMVLVGGWVGWGGGRKDIKDLREQKKKQLNTKKSSTLLFGNTTDP